MLSTCHSSSICMRCQGPFRFIWECAINACGRFIQIGTSSWTRNCLKKPVDQGSCWRAPAPQTPRFLLPKNGRNTVSKKGPKQWFRKMLSKMNLKLWFQPEKRGRGPVTYDCTKRRSVKNVFTKRTELKVKISAVSMFGTDRGTMRYVAILAQDQLNVAFLQMLHGP